VFYKKTAGKVWGKFADLCSNTLKEVRYVFFIQFHDMLNENEQKQDTASGLNVFWQQNV
jgi:hypothetical protein